MRLKTWLVAVLGLESLVVLIANRVSHSALLYRPQLSVNKHESLPHTQDGFVCAAAICSSL
jgi:hypothetical protein